MHVLDLEDVDSHVDGALQHRHSDGEGQVEQNAPGLLPHSLRPDF